MAFNKDTLINQHNDYEFHVFDNNIVIATPKSNESIEITAAESLILTTLLATVAGMMNFKTLPPKIKETPFEIRFSPEGICTLTRDFEDKGVRLLMEEMDEVIKGVKLCVLKIQDMSGIRGGPEAGTPAFDTPDPVLEGR